MFEVFARHLPHGRRYGVVAGTGRLLDALAAFRFGEPELDFVRAAGLADDATLDFLRSYRFSGDIWGYAEGECYFPGSPILVVEGTFAEAVILETLVLSVLNHDCAIASAASRMVTAAGSRPLIEMGSRRTHEQAAVASARAAYLAGFATTSNLRAGQQYGIPTAGTSAHAFTLVHDGEQAGVPRRRSARWARAPRCWSTPTTWPPRYATAVEVAGPDLGAVRIDSGDLPVIAGQVRSLLDALGARQTRIVLTGDLDELLDRGAGRRPGRTATGWAPRWSPGPACPPPRWCTSWSPRQGPGGPGAPLQPVAKRSVGKPGRGGRKWATRVTRGGTAVTELITTEGPAAEGRGRPLLRPLVRGGEITGREPLTAARDRHRAALAELPAHALSLARGYPALPTVFEPDQPDVLNGEINGES